MSAVAEILEKIEKLTLLEASDLVKQMEDKFGVSAAPIGIAAVAMPQAQDASADEAEAEVTVTLVDVGSEKIAVLKEIRNILPGITLKDAKDLVDNVPKPVKESIAKKEAQEIKEKLEKLGAKVEVK